MRRIVLFLLLIVASLLVELVMPRVSVDFSEGETQDRAVATVETHPATAVEAKVFCQSVVMITLPEKRWVAYITHPNGGSEALEESVRRLPQSEIPDPWPSADMLEHYEVLNTACFSWPEIFEMADTLYLGQARSRLEEPDAPITIFDMRRALMKLFFKDKWHVAEGMFPLR